MARVALFPVCMQPGLAPSQTRERKKKAVATVVEQARRCGKEFPNRELWGLLQKDHCYAKRIVPCHGSSSHGHCSKPCSRQQGQKNVCFQVCAGLHAGRGEAFAHPGVSHQTSSHSSPSPGKIKHAEHRFP